MLRILLTAGLVAGTCGAGSWLASENASRALSARPYFYEGMPVSMAAPPELGPQAYEAFAVRPLYVEPAPCHACW